MAAGWIPSDMELRSRRLKRRLRSTTCRFRLSSYTGVTGASDTSIPTPRSMWIGCGASTYRFVCSALNRAIVALHLRTIAAESIKAPIVESTL